MRLIERQPAHRCGHRLALPKIHQLCQPLTWLRRFSYSWRWMHLLKLPVTHSTPAIGPARRFNSRGETQIQDLPVCHGSNVTHPLIDTIGYLQPSLPSSWEYRPVTLSGANP